MHKALFTIYRQTSWLCFVTARCSCPLSRQTVLQTGDFDRDELEEIESEMSQKTRLWQGIQAFEEHLEKWESTSFESLDIGAMEAEVVR